MKGCIPEARVINNNIYQFVGSNLDFEIFLKKRENQKKGEST